MTDGPNRQHVLDFLNVLYSGDVEAAVERCTDDVERILGRPAQSVAQYVAEHRDLFD